MSRTAPQLLSQKFPSWVQGRFPFAVRSDHARSFLTLCTLAPEPVRVQLPVAAREKVREETESLNIRACLFFLVFYQSG